MIIAAAAAGYYYWCQQKASGSSISYGSDSLGSDAFLRGNEIPSASPTMPPSGSLKVTKVKYS